MFRTLIPWSLLSIRVVITPLIVLFCAQLTDHAVLCMYLIAFTTDYFDGVCARALGTASPGLRKADSAADTLFHLALAWFIFRHHRGEIDHARFALALFLLSAVVWYGMDAIRWRRIAGFHAYSAKLFSILLLIWIVQLLRGGATGPMLTIVLTVGAISNVEGIVISLRLRKDQTDVRSVMLMRNVSENTK